MAARAMWKGVICLDDERVPVKLYAAVEDRSIHFRLLHGKDRTPVKQVMLNPRTEQIVPHGNTRRGYITKDKDVVVLNDSDLSTLEPEPSRAIHVLAFVPPATLDHRWYRRPYYLGPDNDPDAWSALVAALEESGREGLVRWTMRKKEYLGALRLHQGYPMLVSLRHAEEVVSVASREVPQGPELSDRELSMAQQLVSMLEVPFEPETYREEYRERVLELIETKRQGGRVRKLPARRRRPSKDLAGALEASVKQERNRA